MIVMENLTETHAVEKTKLDTNKVESILRDLGPRSTSCLAYHPHAGNFTGCNWRQKRASVMLSNFFPELEWCLDERDRDNVRDARAVLDSLDMDNDLEVFHFKVIANDRANG